MAVGRGEARALKGYPLTANLSHAEQGATGGSEREDVGR